MRRRTLAYSAGGAAVAIAFGVVAVLLVRPALPEGILVGSGQVQGTEVTISARVGGVATAIAAREGRRVRKGELLAQIDAREIEARLAQARAEADALQAKRTEIQAQLKALATSIDQARIGAKVSRDSSRHEIHGAREAVARSAAEVRAAETEAERTAKMEARYADLARRAFVSQSYYEDIQSQAQAADARLRAARRAHEETIAALQRAQAGAGEVCVRERDPGRLAEERRSVEASLETLAHTEQAARARATEIEAALADTRLVAPVDATVISRLAEPGELVSPGRPIVTLVDLDALYVRVYIPEREIAKIRLGNPAHVHADAFPDRQFSGRVVEVAQRAEFTPKEVHVKEEREKLVFGVKVALDNPDGHLKPGMPVDVEIKWQDDAEWPRLR